MVATVRSAIGDADGDGKSDSDGKSDGEPDQSRKVRTTGPKTPWKLSPDLRALLGQWVVPTHLSIGIQLVNRPILVDGLRVCQPIGKWAPLVNRAQQLDGYPRRARYRVDRPSTRCVQRDGHHQLQWRP
jgi:hypothetical protein